MPSMGLVGLSSHSMLAGLGVRSLRGELFLDRPGIRDVHGPEFQEAFLRQLGGHHQGPGVAVRGHDQDAAGGNQGQRGADRRKAGRVQQAGQLGAFELAERLFERVPGGVGVPAVAAVAVGQRPVPK